MGDLNFPLQHDLSLKRLALTVLISNIYEDPAIKNHLQKKISTRNEEKKKKSDSSFSYKTLKIEIIKLAAEKVKKLTMPKCLISEALIMVVMFAKNLISWTDYVTRISSLDVSYLDEIHWTYFGTIDEAKTYKSYRKKHGNFKKILKSDRKNHEFASQMACIHGDEEAILSRQDKMIKEVQKFLKGPKLPNIKNQVDQIAAMYICFLYGQSYDILKEKNVYERFKQTGKVNNSETIFMCEDVAGAKFLWKFLTDSEKERVIMELAHDSVYNGLYCSINDIGNIDFADEDNAECEMITLAAAADLALFLINQMTFDQKTEFLRNHASAVLQLFSQVWPYQEICLKLLDEQLVREVISQDAEDLLHTLLPCMTKNSADMAVVPEACLQETAYHELLGKVFSVAPKGTKEQVLFDKEYYYFQDWSFPDAIVKFYKAFDVNSLRVIVNDKDLENERDLMIRVGSSKISKLIKNGELKIIIYFIERVLINKDERKKFIRNWNLENNSLVAENPDIQEKISTWLRA